MTRKEKFLTKSICFDLPFTSEFGLYHSITDLIAAYLNLASVIFAPEIQNLPPCVHPQPSFADRCQQHAVIFKRTARLGSTGFKIVLFDKESFEMQRNSNLKTFIIHHCNQIQARIADLQNSR